MFLPSIIMQFADDGNLYQKQSNKLLFEENEIWNVLIQILIGLKSLHAHNILRRDLKVKNWLIQSANIFLNKSGEAKLGDLNVSKIELHYLTERPPKPSYD